MPCRSNVNLSYWSQHSCPWSHKLAQSDALHMLIIGLVIRMLILQLIIR